MGAKERKSGMPIDLQVDPRNPRRIFVNNYGGGNFVSENGGETWVDASAGYTGAMISSLVVVPGSGAELYVGADTGTYHSSDGGETWPGVGLDASPALALLPGAACPVIPFWPLRWRKEISMSAATAKPGKQPMSPTPVLLRLACALFRQRRLTRK